MMPYFDLSQAAATEMEQNGFPLDESKAARSQLAQIVENGAVLPEGLEDLRSLPWSSIDNDTSRDLDQIEYAEENGDAIRILVAIADVSGTIAKDTPLDQFAAFQTQTVYTATRNFPMLPNELSTGLTSLNAHETRSAMVIEYTVSPEGALSNQRIYFAWVCNKAQLAYSRVGPFLEADGNVATEISLTLAGQPELQRQLKLQDKAAQWLRAARARAGSLDFRRGEAQPIVLDGRVQSIKDTSHNRAMDLIEDLMIASNETIANALRAQGRTALRRIVRTPAHWPEIVALAAEHGGNLPQQPDSLSLNHYLQHQRIQDPDHYPDLALAIIKLMGRGEYVVSPASDPHPPAHFALAAQDYSHSTAPNRRFPDLVTQRLVKAMLHNEPAPYTNAELAAIAEHCNEREHAANKVERAMLKRVSAVAMQRHLGESFTGIVTGASQKGTYVRVFNPPVEGRVVHGEDGMRVGDKVRVKLTHLDPQRAFIDFARS